MKKYLKILIIFIVAIILLLAINIIRNICIINKLKNNVNIYFSDMNSYKLTISSKYSTVNQETEERFEGDYIQEIYYKDNNFIKKDIFYCDGIENEETQITEVEENIFPDIMKIDFLLKELSPSDSLILYCFSFIKTNNESYIIKLNQDVTTYFNKETGLLEKYNNDLYDIEKNIE